MKNTKLFILVTDKCQQQQKRKQSVYFCK